RRDRGEGAVRSESGDQRARTRGRQLASRDARRQSRPRESFLAAIAGARARSRGLRAGGTGRRAGAAAREAAVGPRRGFERGAFDDLRPGASAGRRAHAAGTESPGLRPPPRMSKARKAATIAAFAYCQYGLAVVTGIFLVPLILHTLGARTWGLWLASSEVLAYAGMVDLGVLGVMQWILAAAIGRNDREEQKMLVSQGVWLGFCVAIVYGASALVAWRVLSPKMFLTDADRAIVAKPLAM